MSEPSKTPVQPIRIPYHRPSLGDDEIVEVTNTLKSGWLTTGLKTKQFEKDFAAYVGAKHAVALNSATAALHLALEAIGLQRGEAVLVPTMTFAATAEVVRYFDAKPILVDCQEHDLNIDPDSARKQAEIAVARGEKLRAIIPVHYGGKPANMPEIIRLARDYNISVIEDAAHCCPAHYRTDQSSPWIAVGTQSAVSCFSFYANKCITTGEGGMACTNDDQLAERMRIMALHGISKDAWKRFTSEGSWYYEIIAPGFKYNLTDIASSIGLHQLKKADGFRVQRETIAIQYQRLLSQIPELTVIQSDELTIHSWHLLVVKINTHSLSIDRAEIITRLNAEGIGTSVHWMPLHMHPYYRQTFGYVPMDFPVANEVFSRIISLPIFPGLTESEVESVCRALEQIILAHRLVKP